MKKIVRWLAKVFDVNTVEIREVVKEVVEYRYLTQGTIEGDVFIQGDLLINGKLVVNGGVTFYGKEG